MTSYPGHLTSNAPQLTTTLDAARWPDVSALPRAGVRSRVAGALFRRAVRGLPVRVVLPDGSSAGAGGEGDPRMRLRRSDAFLRRLGAGGLIGFGEAYQAGDWDSEDLPELLTVFAERVATLVPAWLQRGRSLYVQHAPRTEAGAAANTRNNISRHYDLSNDLFDAFLDPSLTYSCALFDAAPDTRAHGPHELLAAQHRKIDRLLDLACVGAGTHLLEIGTGWGGLAIRAACRGALVRSITLSEEQARLARRRVREAGLQDRVTIELCDYRACSGSYDAVVSVEMVEAVGYEYWKDYFAVLQACVKPGGYLGLQTITMPHSRMLATKNTYTWIQKYIFPGGLIPSLDAIAAHIAHDTTLALVDDLAFGRHYAQTLSQWAQRFELAVASGRTRELGFDETFERTWRLYLAYAEAGFRSGYLDVHQLTYRKPRTTATDRSHPR